MGKWQENIPLVKYQSKLVRRLFLSNLHVHCSLTDERFLLKTLLIWSVSPFYAQTYRSICLLKTSNAESGSIIGFFLQKNKIEHTNDAPFLKSKVLSQIKDINCKYYPGCILIHYCTHLLSQTVVNCEKSRFHDLKTELGQK
jgi:hypothetical protein